MRKKRESFFKINAYFAKYMRKCDGLLSTEDNKHFDIYLKQGQSLNELIDTLYHELTHVIVSLLERTPTFASKIKSTKIVTIKMTPKKDERICEKVAKVATETFLKNLCSK